MTNPLSTEGDIADIAEDVRRTLRWLVIATVVLFLALGGTVVYVLVQAGNTNTVLCTYRADLATRVVTTTEFLRDHPKGIPGVPTKLLLDQIANQQRALLAFKDLSCPTGISEALKSPPKPGIKE